MSSSDEEIRKEVWRGQVPICFSLSENELSTLNGPPPLYLQIPRASYLPLYSATLKRHFGSSVATVMDEIWFEYKGRPIKWHYPIGVLYDWLTSSEELPWNITVHFQSFPSDQIMKCPNEEIVKRQFMNATKEAIYVRYGDCSRVNSLSVSDSMDLWEGLKKNVYSQFWNSNSKLLTLDPQQPLKRVPLRIFQKNSTTCTQEAVLPVNEKGAVKTLGNVLAELFPSSQMTDPPKVLIQGVSPPLHTPINWLSEHLIYADNFVYITLL